MAQDNLVPASAPVRFQGHDFLLVCGVPWTTLAAEDEMDLDRSFQRLGRLVDDSPHHARVHFGITRGAEVRSWSLEIGPEGAKVIPGFVHGPDLELLLGEETWRRITRGELAPLDAFGQGKMRVIGDLRVARYLAERLTARESQQEGNEDHGSDDRKRDKPDSE
ncbi:SCP2 sterol-binding domain-containing protein [Streptomyces sp. NPDC090445]|uniref:SCP2 sterol-binding domain-containing protein n=1 Tax=Streptomyces sp. NPDC090445 TaxID=3365963 RepID=UPI00382C1D6B